MARPPSPLDPDERELLDLEAWDVPRRLTRREGTRSAGPDWVWVQPYLEETDDHE